MKTGNVYFYFLLIFCLNLAAFSYAGNGIIKGIVYESKTFEVVSDVRIYLYRDYQYIDVEWSDEEGIFTLESIDSGWYSVLVRKDSYLSIVIDSIRVDTNEIVLLYPSIRYLYGYSQNRCAGGDNVSRDFNYSDAIKEYHALSGLNLYPNPVSEIMTIQRKYDTPIEVKIINNDGTPYDSFKWSEKQKTLNLQHLPAGLYTIIFKSAEVDQDFRFLKL